MTKREHADRNIGMTFDFIRYLIENPEAVEKIPNGSELDFIDKDAPCRLAMRTRGKKVARYRVEHTFERIGR